MKILLQTDEVVVVDCGEVRPALESIAAVVGLDPALLLPIGSSESECLGLHAFALSAETHAEMVAAFASGEAAREFRAIVPVPVWSDGVFDEAFRSAPATTRFEVLETRGPRSEVSLLPGRGDEAQIRFHLARAGLPIAGDTRRGGDPVRGGLRLRCRHIVVPSLDLDLEGAESVDFWPDDAPPGDAEKLETLVVSRATALAIGRGHPWILPDDETSDVEKLRPGSIVQVDSVQGRRLGQARIEGCGRIAARIWSRKGSDKRSASVEARVAGALRRRKRLIDDPETDAVRLIHGEADGLPGLFVDRLGPALRILLTGRACAPLVDRVCDAIVHGIPVLGPNPPVVRTVHLADAPSGRLRGVELIRGSLDDSTGSIDAASQLYVRESGLLFRVDLGLGSPYRPRPGTGLFLDQRDNRSRIAARAASGGRWLNLFCHTGGFTVAALAAGASEVVSVDLSAPYLSWLDTNVALNGLDFEKHRSVQMDARHYVERLDAGDLFDGIICDPPTAARAGRRFWSVRSGGGELVSACLKHLRPGGELLLCRNDRSARGTLEPLVRKVAESFGPDLASVEAAPPGLDFPSSTPFPEGDAFEGVWVTRA